MNITVCKRNDNDTSDIYGGHCAQKY